LEYDGGVKKEVSEKIIIVQSSSDLSLTNEKTESEYLSDLVDSLCDEEFDSLDFDDELISNFIQNFGSEMYLRKFSAAQVKMLNETFLIGYQSNIKVANEIVAERKRAQRKRRAEKIKKMCPKIFKPSNK